MLKAGAMCSAAANSDTKLGKHKENPGGHKYEAKDDAGDQQPIDGADEETPRLLNPLEQLYAEDQNILVASWFDDLRQADEEQDAVVDDQSDVINDYATEKSVIQKDTSDRLAFYNSETLLNDGDFLAHFSEDNKKLLEPLGIEFCCKKGKKNSKNQDNFFVLSEGKSRIMGVFDGHGANGHLTSSFVMAAMVDYIQNSKRFKDLFREQSGNGELEADDEMVTKAIRKCFRYAQDKVKD